MKVGTWGEIRTEKGGRKWVKVGTWGEIRTEKGGRKEEGERKEKMGDGRDKEE